MAALSKAKKIFLRTIYTSSQVLDLDDECPSCNGTGYLPYKNVSQICSTCGGSGVIENYENMPAIEETNNGRKARY